MNLSTWQTILVASTTMKQHVSVNGFYLNSHCIYTVKSTLEEQGKMDQCSLTVWLGKAGPKLPMLSIATVPKTIGGKKIKSA